MGLELEHDILNWVGEEIFKTSNYGQKTPIVPVKVLMMRLALNNREAGEDLSQSLELSLNTFDRANLFRVLRQLEKRGHVLFVDMRGNELPDAQKQALNAPDAADKILGFVTLTQNGENEIKRLKNLQAQTSEEVES